jgi:hypothetical protein
LRLSGATAETVESSARFAFATLDVGAARRPVLADDDDLLRACFAVLVEGRPFA